MFNDALFSGKKKRLVPLTWLTMPLSLLFHALLIASLVVVPLLRADASLPRVKVFSVSITAPPMPLPPGKGPGGKPGDRTKTDGGKSKPDTKDPPKGPLHDGLLKVPFDIPTAIAEEDLGKIGTGDGGAGGGGGIEDGFDGGDPNALIGDDTIDLLNVSQAAIRVLSVQMPRKIKEVKPVYSEIAIRARISGRVIIEAMTDIYGRVHSARVISSVSPLLNESALNAIKQWRYEPYVVNGIPKAVVFTVTITFALEK